MAEYTPTVDERRRGAKAIEAALNQCGIAVRYAISGTNELFDVASVLLKSDFMAAHDAEVRADQIEKDARIADDLFIAQGSAMLIEAAGAIRAQLPEPPASKMLASPPDVEPRPSWDFDIATGRPLAADQSHYERQGE